jgi:hypothetical protein
MPMLGYITVMLMIRIVTILAGLVVSTAAVAEPSCNRPETDTFLENSREAIHFGGAIYPAPTARFLPFMLNGRQFQWMEASWEGPRDGALFVLDCAGSRIVGMPLGYIEQLRPGPVISGFGQTFEVIYISGQGTGALNESVDLVSFSGASIAVLWNHEASEMAAVPQLGADYTDTWSRHYSPDGTVIRVSGHRAIGDSRDAEHDWAPHTDHLLSKERFCWKSSEQTYLPCSGR